VVAGVKAAYGPKNQLEQRMLKSQTMTLAPMTTMMMPIMKMMMTPEVLVY